MRLLFTWESSGLEKAWSQTDFTLVLWLPCTWMWLNILDNTRKISWLSSLSQKPGFMKTRQKRCAGRRLSLKFPGHGGWLCIMGYKVSYCSEVDQIKHTEPKGFNTFKCTGAPLKSPHPKQSLTMSLSMCCWLWAPCQPVCLWEQQSAWHCWWQSAVVGPQLSNPLHTPALPYAPA